jgi:hypothetical protein
MQLAQGQDRQPLSPEGALPIEWAYRSSRALVGASVVTCRACDLELAQVALQGGALECQARCRTVPPA